MVNPEPFFYRIGTTIQEPVKPAKPSPFGNIRLLRYRLQYSAQIALPDSQQQLRSNG
jgi:hypothetical protein